VPEAAYVFSTHGTNICNRRYKDSLVRKLKRIWLQRIQKDFTVGTAHDIINTLLAEDACIRSSVSREDRISMESRWKSAKTKEVTNRKESHVICKNN